MSILDLKTLAFLAFAAGLLLFTGSPNSVYAQENGYNGEEIEETNEFEENIDEEKEELPPVEDLDEEENIETPKEDVESSSW